jgi:hypothetical protein
VNQDANRQIQKSQFNQVPLIEILVKTFKSLFLHLFINHVWLLCKSTQNDIFQGWNQDIVTHWTQTIVINFRSAVNDDELEMGNVWSLPAEALCSSNSSELNEEREVTLRSHAILRKNPEEEKEKDGFEWYLGVFHSKNKEEEDEEEEQSVLDEEVMMMPMIVPHQNFSPPVERQSKEHHLVLTMKTPLSPENEK